MEEAFVITKQNQIFCEDLCFSFAGYSQTYANHSYGPALRDVYVIHIILGGKGSYAISNQRYFLKAGQGFVVPPGETTFYQADENDPWSYVWIGLDGRCLPRLLAEAGLQEGVWSFDVTETQFFKALIFESLSYREAGLRNDLALQRLSYQFLELLLTSCQRHHHQLESQDVSHFVQATLDMIRLKGHDPLSVASISQKLAVNPSYLSRIFKKEMGMTIKDYMTEVRLNQAADLLMATDMSVEDIALTLGFSGSPSFSKAFKQTWGQSPASFRKRELGFGTKESKKDNK